MNKAFLTKEREGIKLECSWLTFSLFFTLFFTSFNGFIDSIDYEYGATDFWQCTFLGEPVDRHGDLVKSALSLASTPSFDIWDWSPHYQYFYDYPYYGKLGDVSTGRVTVFGITPLALLILTGTLQAILATGPSFVMVIYYMVAWLWLGFLCWYFIADYRERILAFVVLALGYPFMFMLTRASLGALIVGFALILYIYLACNQRNLIITALCLAIACNIRPNAVLLAPLLLCFGLRKSIGAFAIFFATAGIITASSYAIAVNIYPGYSWHVFFQALENYKNFYIIGGLGDGNNNAAYGAIKTIYNILLLDPSPKLLDTTNKFIFCACAGLIVFALYKFLQGRLPVYYFAFVITSLYILASTVFGTYHLLVLYAFILAAGCKPAKGGPYPPLLLLMSALVIIPKNYIYIFPNLSCEVILNPLILILSLSWILFFKLPAQGKPTVKENSLA